MRYFTLKMFLLCALGLIASKAGAETLDITHAIKVSLERNLDIKVSEVSLKDKNALITKALGDFDFNLSATLTRDHSETPSASSLDGVSSVVRSDSSILKPTFSKKTRLGTELSVPYSYTISESNSSYNRIPIGHSVSLGLKITQPILKAFERGYFERNLTRAELDLDNARAKHGEKIDDIALKTTELFLDALRERESVRVQKLMLKNAEFSEEFVKAKHQVGKSSMIEVLEAAAARLRAVESLLSSEQQAATKLDELSAHVYGKLPESLELDHNVDHLLKKPEKINFVEALNHALKRRPEVVAQRAASQKADLDLKYAKADLLPTLNFEGSYTHKGLADGFTSSQEQITKGQFPSWSAGLKFERPIMQYASQAALESKRLQREQQNLKEKQVRRDIELELKKFIRDADVNFMRLQALDSAATAQRQRLHGQSERFKARQISVSDLNKARVDAETAEIDLIKARYALAKSRLKLNLAVSGQDLTNSSQWRIE
jgi:outer membrane protein TolC